MNYFNLKKNLFIKVIIIMDIIKTKPKASSKIVLTYDDFRLGKSA